MKDLNRLVTAVESGDHGYYHGDVREGVVDALNELIEIKETIECIDGEPTIEQLAATFEQLKEYVKIR